jgi:UDP-glucose:(heptosyl)LPS alpha-1,3-glucosyltransferase
METKMRFATAILDFSKKRGGAERYLVDLCTRMADEGHEVNVYAEHWDEETQVIHFHPVKTIPFPRSLQLLSFAIRATKEIEKGNYDITFGIGNHLKSDVLQPHGGVHWAWFWRSLRAYSNPALWTMKFLGRVLSPRQWVSGWIEDAPYRGKKRPRIIAISDMVKQDIMRWYGVPENQIAVIYNGVDIERFNPRNRQCREEIRKRHGIGDEIVILFVSNNFRMKGLDILMKALAGLKEGGYPPTKLLVLGRGRGSPYLHLAKKMRISGEVVFVGSTDEIEKYYGAADLFVHPSFYDACSLATLEALASGVSVITTTCNGASSILIHGENGWLIQKPGDVNGLSMAIKDFLKQKAASPVAPKGGNRIKILSEKENFNQVMEIFKEVIRD